MSTDRRREEVLDRLILDIKAFVLLQGTDRALQSRVQERLLDSHDEEVRQFVESVQAGRKRGVGQLLVIGLGELVFASVLVLVGTVTLVPTMVGLHSPQDLIVYFSSQILPPLQNSPISQYASAVEFLVGALLLLAAFFTLRQAALNFRGMGLSAGQSGE